MRGKCKLAQVCTCTYIRSRSSQTAIIGVQRKQGSYQKEGCENNHSNKFYRQKLSTENSLRALTVLTNERLTFIVNDGHINSVLWTNPYTEFIRCLHNACLKVLHLLKDVIIHDVNENGGGQCSRGRIISISESSLM